MLNKKDIKIILQDRGISATHPIIFKKMKEKVIVCSVADEKRKLNTKFNYTIIFDLKNFPFNKGKEEILNHIIRKEFFLEAEEGHELAIRNGLSEETLNTVKELAKESV